MTIRKVIILLVILAASYFVYTKISSAKTPAPQYLTASAETGTLITTVSASGSVAATNSRTVTTTASGVVKKVYVTEGQKVTSGTPIMLIDLDMDGRQKYQSAYSSYQSAQNSLVAAKAKLLDLESSFVGDQNVFINQWANQSPNDPTYIQKHNAFLSSQSAYDNQVNVIKQVQSSLESSRLSFLQSSPTVYAPISGTVSAISLAPGMILNPTSTAANSSNAANKIAIVKTNTTPAISVSLTEIDVPKVHVGNKATITLSAFPDKTFTGKIIAVDTSGTVSSNVVSYPTTIQFDTDFPDIFSNMSADVKIITAVKDNVILVPSAAIQTTNGQSVVRLLKNNQVSSVVVEVGNSNDTQTEIISGINEGDTVVTGTTSTTTTPSTGTSIFGGGNRGGFGGAVRIGGAGR